MSVLTPEQAREWCAAKMDMVRNRVLVAGFVQHMRDTVPVLLDQLVAARSEKETLRKAHAAARNAAFREIADIADALANQQGIKSELTAALRARLEDNDGAL